MESVPLLGISIWLIAKILTLGFLGMYIIFALVIIKQISLMLSTVDMGYSLPIRMLGFLHLLFSIGTFILALIIL